MEIKDIKKPNKKDVMISVRTTKIISDWMNQHNISPTELFNKSANELMLKQEIINGS